MYNLEFFVTHGVTFLNRYVRNKYNFIIIVMALS